MESQLSLRDPQNVWDQVTLGVNVQDNWKTGSESGEEERVLSVGMDIGRGPKDLTLLPILKDNFAVGFLPRVPVHSPQCNHVVHRRANGRPCCCNRLSYSQLLTDFGSISSNGHGNFECENGRPLHDGLIGSCDISRKSKPVY